MSIFLIFLDNGTICLQHHNYVRGVAWQLRIRIPGNP